MSKGLSTARTIWQAKAQSALSRVRRQAATRGLNKLSPPAIEAEILAVRRRRGIVAKLRGRDRRSIGQSNQVAQEISDDPELFRLVFEAVLDDDPLVRMRAADAVEKATRKNQELLQPYKRKLLRQVAVIEQKEIRWHAAQMLPRLRLSAKDRDLAVSILFTYLENKSSIVRTFAMQALADFALQNPQLRPRVARLLESLTHTGTPAMRARGRKLRKVLQRLTVLPQ